MAGAGRAARSTGRGPGTGYLLLLFGLAALGCLTCGLAAPELPGAGRIEWIAAIVVAACVGGLVVATVDAAFRTQYEISDRELRLRSGFVIGAVILYRDVATVERVGFTPRVLGWGGGRGLANRLTDGLRITLHSGAVYYVSPSDPGAFAELILAGGPHGRDVPIALKPDH